MDRTKSELLAKRIYDSVHMALWATLTAFVLWFAVFVLPRLPELRARAAGLHAQEVAAEQDLACATLGMGPKSPMYRHCIADLAAYRTRIERRLAAESDIF